MHLTCEGTLSIGTNKGDSDIDLKRLGLSSFDGNEYINVTEFDYKAIFEDLLLCAGYNRKDYETPTNREEFNKSPFWKTLGFEITDDFEVLYITKDLTIEHYMTYKQRAGYAISIRDEGFLVNAGYMLSNEIDYHIFEDWHTLYFEDCEIGGGEIMDSVVRIFNNYFCINNPDLEAMDAEIHAYFDQFITEENEKLTDEEIKWFTDAMRRYLD